MQEMTGIYTNSVSNELSRTKRLLDNDENYKLIAKFARDTKLSDGLTDFRIMFYITRLRHIASILEGKFNEPTEEDLKDCISKLSTKGIAPRSIEDYKQTMKKFYSWRWPSKDKDKEHRYDSNKYKKSCSWIHVRTNVDRLKKSEDMMTVEEVNLIIANCKNTRDKAMVSLLYDSGCRISELLTIRLKDLKLDDRGMSMKVTGKTGERTVYVVGDSIAYIREWRESHPDRENGEALLFIDLVSREPLNYYTARKALMAAVKRCDIKKRVHPHLFRHSYASRYSEVVTEGILKQQLGWTGSSRMAEKYVHLSAQQQKNAILVANGLEPEEKTLKTPELRVCQRCGEKNASTAEFCSKCWFPLTLEGSLELKQKEELAKNALLQTTMITDSEKSLLGSVSPQAQLEIEAILLRDLKKKGLLEALAKETVSRNNV